MAVNVSKIRLGAPSQVLVGAQDMGATKGGVVLKYNPTQLLIECDQFLAPVQAFRTKEECTAEMSFYQTQIALLAYAFALNGLGVTSTTPGNPTVDKITFGGNVVVLNSTMDMTVPKNDNSTNNMLVHLNKVHSMKETSLNFARDKETEYKSVFNCLADTTQAAGQQLGYISEQY